jgi:HEAT repeat protein
MSSAAPVTLRAQEAAVSFEETIADLRSDNPRVRLRAVERLEGTPYREAAVPLAAAVGDSDDGVQMRAIAAELNIFLAEPVVPRRRVGGIIELRNRISAEAIFEQGSSLLDPRPVPGDVLAALRATVNDEHPEVAREALYAFGALADNAYGAYRIRLLGASAAELAAALGSADTGVRLAAVRTIGHVYAWRPGDPGIPELLGDPIVTLLNDRSFDVKLAASDALGALRYGRAVQALTAIFEHYEQGTTAASALEALARIAHPSSEALFATALGSRAPAIRVAAIEGLARLGVVGQAAAIEQALADSRDDDLRLAVEFARVLLGAGPMDGLVEGLTHPDTRSRALQYLAEAIPGRSRLLAPHMPDPVPAVRADLLEAVGLSGDPTAVGLAERLRNDTDPLVARAVERALARLGAPAAARP